jgi:transaldolase
LRGTAAVANAKLIYQRFKEIFGSERFNQLRAKGARVQRPLWASTGTKNPAYTDIKYVQELIGPDTVNTMPPATMDAFRDHGRPQATIEQGLVEARETVRRLSEAGIDLIEIGERLQEEGVEVIGDGWVQSLPRGLRPHLLQPTRLSAPPCARFNRAGRPARRGEED